MLEITFDSKNIDLVKWEFQMKKIWQAVFVIVGISTNYNQEAIAATNQIWGDFPLIRDARNFKESSGGKGVPAQGRVIEKPELSTLIINEDAISRYSPTAKNWRHAVTMNCRRGDGSIVDTIRKTTQLIPEDERHRLAIVFGINERVTVENPLEYAPTWNEILSLNDRKALQDLNVPILLVYFQWTSFRESTKNPRLGAYEVRHSIFDSLNKIPNLRQRETTLAKLKSQDIEHQFPFGRARQFLLQNSKTIEFITALHRNDCDVYIHIQDSDFISYQEKLLFGDFQGNAPLIPANQNRLLAKFDELIEHQRRQNGHLPIIIGGAHVYSPTEDLQDYLVSQGGKVSLNSPQAKRWTRFASEIGNNIKHILGIQQPYGLYFHEPNTLILSPISATRRLLKRNIPSNWQKVYERLAAGFSFGIDSEIQEFTRSLFKGIDDETCRQGMIFSSTTVLSTSMKRGKKPFTLKFGGSYNSQTNQFSDYSEADLRSIRGMSQEIISTNDWGSNVATSFKNHRTSDARKFLYEALRLFDPINFLDPSKPDTFSTGLVFYGQRIQDYQQNIRTLFHNLRGYYNKLNQGDIVALQIITAGWETGQVMRSMFLNNLQPPAGTVILAPSRQEQDVQILLAKRFNFTAIDKNQFVFELLGLTPMVRNLTPILPAKMVDIKIENTAVSQFTVTQVQVSYIVSWLYKRSGGNTSQVMREVDVGRDTIPKLISCTAPRAWKTIAEKLKTPQAIHQNFSFLSSEERQGLISMLIK